MKIAGVWKLNNFITYNTYTIVYIIEYTLSTGNVLQIQHFTNYNSENKLFNTFWTTNVGIHANFDITVVFELNRVDEKHVLMCITGNDYWNCELLIVRHLSNSSDFRIECYYLCMVLFHNPRCCFPHAILKTETRCNVWLI